VEAYPYVCVNELRRVAIIGNGRSNAGLAPSSQGCSIWVTYLPVESAVRISVNGTLYSSVPITWTDCFLGGRRPWFACPSCGSRRSKLQLVEGALGCRVCLRLKYQGQLLRHPERQLVRAQQLRLVLGQVSGQLGDPLPQRPRHMTQARYLRQVRILHEAETAYLQE
jgi:hypothetical protein